MPYRQRSTLSPSGLTAYLACPHLAALEVRVVAGDLPRPPKGNAQANLVRTKGEEHEARYLQQLREEGRTILEIPFSDGDFERAATTTAEAIRAAEQDVIYQACLASDGWVGFADFLERTATGTYEAVDTKLARTAKPAAVLQLCFYTLELGRIQDTEPEWMHVVLGTGERESFRPGDFAAYYRRVRNRFARFAAEPPATYPYPCAHCSICGFIERCERQWKADDHLVQVARIRRDQIGRLDAVGIDTMTALGSASVGTAVPRMAASTFEALRDQAELQLGRVHPPWHLLPPEPERGFGLLPAPSPNDLFFDIEGDPFFEPQGGLEYLFGVWSDDVGYETIWAHDRASEQAAFEQLVDLVHARLQADPTLHVYHYAAYERTALKRLAAQYATREEEVDELLRREILVDLYAVVRQALRAGVPSYSIKELESLYGFVRRAELRSGDDSVVLFNNWLESGDDSILADIAAYNAEDCVSTYALREWLLMLRGDLPWREPPDVRVPDEDTPQSRTEREELREGLLAVGDDLAAYLLDYHRREAKPAWWAFFDRLERTASELVDDSESIGELDPDGTAEPAGARSTAYGFTFPPQQHRLDEGDTVIDPVTAKSAGTIDRLDNAVGWLSLSRGNHRAAEPPPRALIPKWPYDTRAQRYALLRLGRSLRAHDHHYSALEKVVRRALPLAGRVVQRETLDEQKTLAEEVEGSYLFVQGPPGSGKTYTGAHIAAHLLKRGKRVGIASTSHKAIHNLLDEVERIGLDVKGLKKCSEGNAESIYTSAHVESKSKIDPFLDSDVRLLAGTAWLFARDELDQELDYLVIDEAGQVSLADALAMGTSARSLILLGDPMQLAQVRQGIHPAGSGASVLEHLLAGHVTVPEDRGLFLEHTRRLHPDVCGFISETFYEGRLDSDAVCSGRTTALGTGLRYLPVEHSGNRQRAPEEADTVCTEVQRLLAAGVPQQEILVVAAYNAQVSCLRDHLPPGMRIGTVDKFQGQEADVVLFSMASSSAEDIPRGLEFLFSANRLNVAISRARCLAYLVASPRLLEVDCRSIAQMRLANALCRFVEIAEQS